MSFVIAVSDGIDAVVAADSQTTNSETMEIIDTNYLKIKRINNLNPLYICFGGNVALAEYVFLKLDSLDLYNSLTISITDCANKILKYADEFISKNNLDRKTVFSFFIIATKNKSYVGNNKYRYSIYGIDTSNRTYKKITNTNEKYLYLYLTSGLISNQKIENIINKPLNTVVPLSLEVKTRKIIKEVSKLDPTVNNNIKSLKVK